MAKKLMSCSIEEFERTLAECFQAFFVWEDEFEKLISMVKEMAKRKREEISSWHLNLTHKQLKARLEILRK